MSDADFHQSGGGRKKKASQGGGSAGGAPKAAAVAEPAKEKEFFDVKLAAFDAKAKIKIIKEIRTITALGLKEVLLCIGQYSM